MIYDKPYATLTEILDQISERRDLIWCILDLDAYGDFKDREDLGTIFVEILKNDEEKKYLLGWDEIYEISKRLTDVIDLLLVGCKNKEIVFKIEKNLHELAKKGYPSSKDLDPIYEILIDIDDGLLRGIFSQDKSITNRCLIEFGPYPLPMYHNE